MKNIIAIICLTSFAGSVLAQQSTEEQCKKSVEASISAAEMASQMNGAAPKIKDLSVNDIRQIQKARGSCAAQQEINKRTLGS